MELKHRLGRMSLVRAALLCLCLIGYTANTAQAHIYVPQGETVDVQMCGLHGDRTVTLTLGQDGPVQLTDDSCCGPCLTSAMPGVPILFLPQPALPRAAPVIRRRGLQPVLTYSIWPGAPPNGPPVSLES